MSGPLTGSTRRPTSTLPLATTTAPAKQEAPLAQLLAQNPGLKTNQDLINYCFKNGGNNYAGAAAFGKTLGVDLGKLSQARTAALPGREATAATPSTGTPSDSFADSEGTNPTVTGRQTPVFKTGEQPVVKADTASQAQLAQQLTQARLTGLPKKETPAEGGHAEGTPHGAGAHAPHGHTQTNLDGTQGAADATAVRIGPSFGESHLRSGTTVGTSARRESGFTVTDRTRSSTTRGADGSSTSVDTRTANVTKNGASMTTTSAEVHTTNADGSSVTGKAKSTIHNGNTTTTSSGTSEAAPAKPTVGQKIKDTATHAAKDTKATLYHSETILAEGAATEGLKKFNEGMIAGTDPLLMKQGKVQGNAAGAKLEVGTYEVKTGHGAYIQNGKLHAGADITASAVLVGASARAQAGDSTTVLGQVNAQGEAKIAAEGTAGARATIDLTKNPTVEVSAGAKAFAGAKAEGSVAYQNRYAGVTAKGEASAGIGGEAYAGASLKDGRLKVGVALSGTLGLGLGGKIEVDVNVGAIAKDAYSGAKAAGSWVGEKLGWW